MMTSSSHTHTYTPICETHYWWGNAPTVTKTTGTKTGRYAEAIRNVAPTFKSRPVVYPFVYQLRPQREQYKKMQNSTEAGLLAEVPPKLAINLPNF